MEEPNELYQAAVKVVRAIVEKHGNGDVTFVPEKDITGKMTCPVCSNGVMTYGISSYNGHRDAQCSTGCFGYYVE